MTKCSPEFLSLADDCLRQFAQTGNDALSTILTPEDLNAFQASYLGFRARDFPPIKTFGVCQQSCRLISRSLPQSISVRPVWIQPDFTAKVPVSC